MQTSAHRETPLKGTLSGKTFYLTGLKNLSAAMAFPRVKRAMEL